MSLKKINLRNIRAILFDLDGVLIDSYPGWFRLFNDALSYFGFDQITEKTFRKHWGQSTAEDVRIFMPGKTVDQVRIYFQEHFLQYLSYLKVNPLAIKTLRALSESGLKLACVTNSHRDIVLEILATYHLDQYFEVILTADDVKNPKPAPDILLEACRLLGVQSNQALFIGDTPTDKKAGSAAGCLFIGYRSPADITVEDMSDFYKLLLG
jgi:HAD superfamily hydrolase (TIGR01509 family)